VSDVIAEQGRRMDGDVDPCGFRIVRGDVNGDGDVDAAVLYGIGGFGRGFDGEPIALGKGSNDRTTILAVFVSRAGRWSVASQRPVAHYKAELGTATGVKVDVDGSLVVEGFDYAQGDANCCPSIKASRHYRLEGGNLVSVTS
jgi:hypothetical protein